MASVSLTLKLESTKIGIHESGVSCERRIKLPNHQKLVMEKENQIWNEYHSLREEIRVADSLNCQIMGIIIGAVALILATGVGQAKPSARVMAFLCSYVITYPG
ncbi:MAG: hypothetical protein ACKOPT_08380, partial [Cyanobium sp.]